MENISIFYGRLLLFVVIWHIFPVLVCLDQEKSGNPEGVTDQKIFIYVNNLLNLRYTAYKNRKINCYMQTLVGVTLHT
jgi:hypothetical protein